MNKNQFQKERKKNHFFSVFEIIIDLICYHRSNGIFIQFAISNGIEQRLSPQRQFIPFELEKTTDKYHAWKG